MAEKTPLHPVIPIALSDTKVVCPCGGEMKPWDFTSFPSQAKWVLWRCTDDSDHVTSAIPVPKERDD